MDPLNTVVKVSKFRKDGLLEVLAEDFPDYIPSDEEEESEGDGQQLMESDEEDESEEDGQQLMESVEEDESEEDGQQLMESDEEDESEEDGQQLMESDEEDDSEEDGQQLMESDEEDESEEEFWGDYASESQGEQVPLLSGGWIISLAPCGLASASGKAIKAFGKVVIAQFELLLMAGGAVKGGTLPLVHTRSDYVED
ncbi:Hypothetical protein SMAX5B_013891 [Scophthalmus maximus]|uniref:Uncharacterized protein n=1 Tax=Scophthalmus maximus TaxID=52904 RepID=A0A2U9CGF5_SCOMX|nr:Hypothetical protein SMAX5B_013891 [Scophthalmus maximus]